TVARTVRSEARRGRVPSATLLQPTAGSIAKAHASSSPLFPFGTKGDLHVALRIQVLARGVAHRRRRQLVVERPQVEYLGNILTVLDLGRQFVEQVGVGLKPIFELAIEQAASSCQILIRRPTLREVLNHFPGG